MACVLVAPAWLASGTNAGVRVALACTLAVIVAAIADLVMLPSQGDIMVTRDAPGSIGIGDRDAASYEITSLWGRALVLTLFEALPATLLDVERPYGDLRLPPHASVRVSVHLTGRQRGTAPLGRTALRVRTTLGLMARTVYHAHADVIQVMPSLAGVRRLRWLALHHRLAVAGVRDARRLGEGRAFARLRDYVVGDDPRHIDWKATARRGRPITREFTVEQSQTVYVLVDAGRSMTQRAGHLPRFEYALSSALVLADAALTTGDRVGAMVFDDQVRALVPPQRGAGALQAIRAALAPLSPTLAEPDYAGAFRVLSQRQRKRALLVLITDVIDSRAARALVAHLGGGVTRHLAVVVALRNEAVLAAAVIPSSGDQEAPYYLAAAAAELLDERAVALQRMRDAGVVVLDVAPGAMAAAIVNQYLALKARGAL